MQSNDANKKSKIVYPELSYVITGLLFKTHNDLGRFCRERQYADALEALFRDAKLLYEREKVITLPHVESATNRVDFAVDGKVLIELKAKSIVLKEDYYQMNRYLEAGKYKLGMIVNFRNRYLKPIRVIRSHS